MPHAHEELEEYRLRWVDNLRPTALFFGAIVLFIVAFTATVRPHEWIPALLVALLSLGVTLLVAMRSRAFYVQVGAAGLRAPHHRHIPWQSVTEAREVARGTRPNRSRSLRIRYTAAEGVERALVVPAELEAFDRFHDTVRAHLQDAQDQDNPTA